MLIFKHNHINIYLLYIEWSTDMYFYTKKYSMKSVFFVELQLQNHSPSPLNPDCQTLKTNGGCDQHLLDLDALLRALQRICLATMGAQGWPGGWLDTERSI